LRRPAPCPCGDSGNACYQQAGSCLAAYPGVR
jgi:hypothetical protein